MFEVIQKLIDTVSGQTFLRKPLVQLMNSIAARQPNMAQHSQIILPSSSSIVEAVSSLSSKQLSYLTKGLKYVPACQNRFSCHSIDKIITQEYQNIVGSFKMNCASAFFYFH